MLSLPNYVVSRYSFRESKIVDDFLSIYVSCIHLQFHLILQFENGSVGNGISPCFLLCVPTVSCMDIPTKVDGLCNPFLNEISLAAVSFENWIICAQLLRTLYALAVVILSPVFLQSRCN